MPTSERGSAPVLGLGPRWASCTRAKAWFFRFLTFDPVRAALIGGWTIRRAAEVLPHKWRVL